MSLGSEIDALRRHLDALAADDDDDLKRYELRHPRMPPGLYWKARWLAGRILRSLEALGLKRPDPWPAGLRQVPGSARSRPLLLWAVGADRETLRAGCRAIADLSTAAPEFAVVLVTDVADFGFFSRLGWLVEYLPEIAGDGPSYAERKARFVARLYRGAPALPIAAAADAAAREEIRRWLESGVETRTAPCRSS